MDDQVSQACTGSSYVCGHVTGLSLPQPIIGRFIMYHICRFNSESVLPKGETLSLSQHILFFGVTWTRHRPSPDCWVHVFFLNFFAIYKSDPVPRILKTWCQIHLSNGPPIKIPCPHRLGNRLLIHNLWRHMINLPKVSITWNCVSLLEYSHGSRSEGEDFEII